MICEWHNNQCVGGDTLHIFVAACLDEYILYSEKYTRSTWRDDTCISGNPAFKNCNANQLRSGRTVKTEMKTDCSFYRSTAVFQKPQGTRLRAKWIIVTKQRSHIFYYVGVATEAMKTLFKRPWTHYFPQTQSVIRNVTCSLCNQFFSFFFLKLFVKLKWEGDVHMAA